jgi:hypothetical protein
LGLNVIRFGDDLPPVVELQTLNDLWQLVLVVKAAKVVGAVMSPAGLEGLGLHQLTLPAAIVRIRPFTAVVSAHDTPKLIADFQNCGSVIPV